VILDFTLVNGIDSSAAQAIVKLKDNLRKAFDVETLICVTGSKNGFPCEFDLSTELSEHNEDYCGSRVFETLDDAVMFAEDALIYRQDPSLVSGNKLPFSPEDETSDHDLALFYLRNICPGNPTEEDIETLLAQFSSREEYRHDDVIWVQGSPGDSIKLVVRGTLISLLENEAGTVETIPTGNTIGELGLVYGTARFSSVRCQSKEAVLLSLSRESYERLIEQNPRLARYIDLICVRYLSNRVQHVSNRIFETRCLPI